MTTDKKISKKKQKLINEFLNSPLQVGERISSIKRSGYAQSKTDYIIVEIDGSLLKVKQTNTRHSNVETIDVVDIDGRYGIWEVGSNPFNEKFYDIRAISYSLDSVLFTLNILGNKREKYDINGIPIMEFNWNPFVYNKYGKKQYYQRDFVWSEDDNKNLIESIYQGIDCGKILVRNRGWDELKEMQSKGETELSFKDIIDGKQRLNAIRGFIMDEFKDKYGNYFSDLSAKSQHLFVNHQLLSYSEMPENTSDSDVLHQFLRMNFAGIPQSKEHLEFVKSISKEQK